MTFIQYAIITREDEIENYIYGHKFVTGLNICPHSEFFHVYDTTIIPTRLPIYVNDTYIRFVSFPPDAQFKYPNPANPYFTIKADKIILSDRLALADYMTADMVAQKHINLQHIPKERRTYSMYLNAIRGCHAWIKEIPEQTDEACLVAVREHCDALLYIHKLTPELCKEGFETAKKNAYFGNSFCCPWLQVIRNRPEIKSFITAP
jgi:hypothetical protein